MRVLRRWIRCRRSKGWGGFRTACAFFLGVCVCVFCDTAMSMGCVGFIWRFGVWRMRGSAVDSVLCCAVGARAKSCFCAVIWGDEGGTERGDGAWALPSTGEVTRKSWGWVKGSPGGDEDEMAGCKRGDGIEVAKFSRSLIDYVHLSCVHAKFCSKLCVPCHVHVMCIVMCVCFYIP